jgi:Ca2+:H+ antiporter
MCLASYHAELQIVKVVQLHNTPHAKGGQAWFGAGILRPLDSLLLAVPMAFAIYLVPAWKNDPLLFLVAGSAIIPLAAWLSRATLHLSDRAGPGLGGLLNATLGNAPELILSLVALSKGLTVLVKASVTGSIIGNILLVLGISILAGGMRFSHQRFNETGTRTAATSLGLAVIALIIPTIFRMATERQRGGLPVFASQNLSLAVAIVLFATYLLWLVFSLISHKDLFAGEISGDVAANREEKSIWPIWKALTILAVSAILIAVMSEFLSGAVEPFCEKLGLTQAFVGVIIIAILGNATESTAVLVALKNKMDLSLAITIGASLQIALLIIPVLVFASYLFGQPMTLELSLPEVSALALAVCIVLFISGDGECNWLEGVQLIAVYLTIAIFFYFLPELS